MQENTSVHDHGSPSDSELWSVTRLKNERDGKLSLEFIFPVGDGTVGSLVLGAEMELSRVVRALRSYTSELPKAPERARNVVEGLIARAAPLVIQTDLPGWKQAVDVMGVPGPAPDAFVTPGQTFGPKRRRYRWAGAPGRKPHIGQVRATLTNWTRAYGPFARHSNYVAFAEMAALASPLCPFASLPEAPVFNFYGPTSTGKTTAVKCGAAVQGHPEAIASWDQTARGLEETAAGHNHLLLVLNAAERSPPKDRQLVLSRITHMVAEGLSTIGSKAVQDRLPDLEWRGITLSTSNRTGREMATDSRIPWAEQDEARFMALVRVALSIVLRRARKRPAVRQPLWLPRSRRRSATSMARHLAPGSSTYNPTTRAT